jgi:glucose-6-phosphate 1-dehydrogenase
MKLPDNFILVIFGASGDLTERKLIPALFDLFRQGLLPEKFAILGVSRSPLSEATFQEKVVESVNWHDANKPISQPTLHAFREKFFYLAIDTAHADDYRRLREKLEALTQQLQINANFLYYLSTPPVIYETIARHLGSQGLNREAEGWKRIIVEKPFGYDLETARALNEKLQSIFYENQIYRIDHYLGKETVQNILVFRFANGIFEPLWNRRYIHHVEITAAESLGIENRGRYFDGAGTLRDMVQNHLLQIAATVAMEPPSVFNANAVRNETVKILQSIRPIPEEAVEEFVVRGQYTASELEAENQVGYREEENVAADSRTETFVALKFFIDNWRWGGVPFYIRSGKRLPNRVTEVVIHYHKIPHPLFKRDNPFGVSENQLILRIQPDEGILLKFGMKLPGAGFEVKNVDMNFRYDDLSDVHVPSAYERLLLDGMLGDATLYARADAVAASWEFIDPILRAWKNHPEIKIYGYPAGTWGPPQAKNLFPNPAEDWHYPCKTLVRAGDACEL